MRHDPRAAILDMVIAVERAIRLLGGRSVEEFVNDEENQWAVFSQIVILGEAAARVPKNEQEAMPEVPWSQAIGMRHRLVHGYDSVDWSRVWQTVRNDLEPLGAALRKRLDEA